MDIKAEFVKQYRRDAILVGMACDICPVILLTQAALETGWGRFMTSNNLFGIKSVPWLPGSIEAVTQEWEGHWQTITAEFQVFDSPLQAMLAYVNLIRNTPRYAMAWKLRHDPVRYFRALQMAGYATDPQYADKLISIYRMFPDWLVGDFP